MLYGSPTGRARMTNSETGEIFSRPVVRQRRDASETVARPQRDGGRDGCGKSMKPKNVCGKKQKQLRDTILLGFVSPARPTVGLKFVFGRI